MASLKKPGQSPLRDRGILAKKYQKHITPKEKFEQSRITKENNRLYSKILDIDKNLQIAYLQTNTSVLPSNQ